MWPGGASDASRHGGGVDRRSSGRLRKLLIILSPPPGSAAASTDRAAGGFAFAFGSVCGGTGCRLAGAAVLGHGGASKLASFQAWEAGD